MIASGQKSYSSKCPNCSSLNDDVLAVAIRLQQCKQELRRSGQVVINFDPQGNINLNQIQWVGRTLLGHIPTCSEHLLNE
jgi:hypothetical protein